jgi:hypothetical protein
MQEVTGPAPAVGGKASEGRGYPEEEADVAFPRGPSHRALGVDAAQVGLEAAHRPAAVAAQLQVAVALVGALHQERDRLGFRLRLHAGGAVNSVALGDARQAA